MKDDITPKYNFKSYESLITDNTTLPNQPMITDSSSYEPMMTDHSNKKNKMKLTKTSNITSKKLIESKPNSLSSLYNESFDKTSKSFEKMIKVIKHANSFHNNAVSARYLEKATLESDVKKLSTFMNLNRIESSTMTMLSKGIMREKDILQYKTNIIKQDNYYLKNKVPYLQDEVIQMKKAIEGNKSETNTINNSIMVLQKDLMNINDDIKKMNKMNSDALASKESINNTLEMLRKHNQRLREMITNQNNKTGELVHSVNVLARNMTKHIQGIATNRKVNEKSLYKQ